ncbi:MAG: magnesium-translocating P-type ATPase [Deltaproteobacteria bacterium]|nr:magnesium-translocating P-type ATPase [Deltaproteobacteria bacterium]
MKDILDSKIKNPKEHNLIELCLLPTDETLKRLGTTIEGLSTDEASFRLEKYGPNELSHLRRLTFYENLLGRFKNPLVVQLIIIAIVSGIIGEIKSTIVVSIMLFLSVGLSFIFDDRSTKAVEALGKQVATRASVLRDGIETEIKISEVVPGDIVLLKAGSIIPADLRLISTRDFFVNESALTGESMPVEKMVEATSSNYTSALELPNACFFGTHVVSGTAKGVAIHTGRDTLFGGISEKLTKGRSETSFDKGVRSFTYLMTKVMILLVFIVFFLVGITKGNWIQALLFGLAIAVGLTPQMLPMIITVNLAKGALSMAKKKVIVKRLPSIQNFGAMDVLCTDKTGTLTQNRVVLKKHVDIIGKTSEEVLHYAYLNSYFQTGLKSLIDSTILEHVSLDVSSCRLVDELPFDFQRRRMSVVVDYEGSHVLICKGAVEEIYACCTHYQIDDHVYPLIDLIRADLFEDVEELNRDGFRVLGIAYREFPREKKTFTVEDEKELILLGYIAFYDPPKDSAIQAIRLLKEKGVRIKVLTGDNGLVTKKICDDVGLKVEKLITGSELSLLSREEFINAVENYDIFVKLSPIQKEEIVRQLRENGHVVGFLGDGINDAPAMKAADVGISVDTAVDVAKESADIVLLEKSLGVLEEGIIEGRKVFANIVKYIRMGSSSNFGNMFSVVGASYLLPFLPMQPIQVLTNNLLYDFSQTAIPTDNVDKEVVERPLKWNIDGIRKFMMFIGPVSSIFDYLTFGLLWFVFGCGAFVIPEVDLGTKTFSEKLFQTGWFVESLLTQTLIIHVIRTKKIPIIESSPSLAMIVTTLIVMAVGVYLPYSPIASDLGFVPLPFSFWIWIIFFLASYAFLTHKIKVWFFNRYGGE